MNESPILLRQRFPESSPEEWGEAASLQLRGSSIKKLQRTLWDGTSIAPIYHRSDLKGHPLSDGAPGFPPFHRGFSPSGLGLAGWGIATVLSSATSSSEMREILREEVEQGATALRLLFRSAATAEHRSADLGNGEKKGKEGFSFDSVAALREALSDILVPHVTIVLDGRAFSGAALALLWASLDDDIRSGPLDLHLIWDPLQANINADYAESGIEGEKQLALLHDIFSTFLLSEDKAKKSVKGSPPQLRLLGIDTTFVAEAGGGPTHELAWLGAALIEYLRVLTAAGHSPREIVRHIGVQLSARPTFFSTAATFRAARIIIGTILGAFGIDPTDAAVPLHALCLRRPLSTLDSHTNALRVTAEIFGAILGGASTITAIPFDSITATESHRSRRLARNTQLILRDEALLGQIIDPVGGSWFIESLTAELAADSWRIIQEIESRGGIKAAIADGSFQRLVVATADAEAQAFLTRRSVLVGVNQYPGEQNSSSGVALESKVGEERKNYDSDQSNEPINDSKTAVSFASTKFLDLVARASQGASLWGLIEDRSLTPNENLFILSPNRNASPFEELRTRTATLPFLPNIQITPIGDALSLRPRVDFSRDFFGIGGFKTEELPITTTPDELAELLPDIPADVIVLCGSDSSYTSLIPEVIKVVENRYGADKPVIVVAGQLDRDAEQLRALGVHSTIHLRVDPITVLGNLVDAISLRSAASCSPIVALASEEHDR